MKVAELYQEALEQGLHLRVDGADLVVGPSAQLTDDLIRRLRQFKPELLLFLDQAHATTEQLLDAAMRACDYWQDPPEARQEMRRQCLELPPDQRAPMRDHFQRIYGKKP